MSHFDPFADDLQPEPVAANNTDAWNETEKKENKVMAGANTEGKIVVTLKGGAGFDAPWIVVHATDAADALEQLNDKVLGELIARTKTVSAHFSGGSGNAGRPASPQSNSRPPQQQAPASAGNAPGCDHGTRVYKSGVSKAGKPYKMWACPSGDRNDQCSPEWIR